MYRFILLFLIFSGKAFAQSNKISWGEVENFTPMSVQIVHKGGNGFLLFYTKEHILGPMFPNLRKSLVREIIALNTVSEVELEFTNSSGKELAPKALNGLSQTIYALTSRTVNGVLRNEVYLHKFSCTNPPTKVKGDLLISYYRKETPLTYKELGIQQSRNESALAAFFTIPVNPIDFQGFGYSVFDNSGTQIQAKVMTFPFKMFEFDFREVVVSDTGVLYVSGDQFFGNNMNAVLNPGNRTFGCNRILSIRKDTLRDLTLSNDQAIIMNQKLSFDKAGNLIVSGFYGDVFFGPYRGVFMMKIDKDQDSILTFIKQPFTAQFLNQEYPSWERPQTNVALIPQHPEQSLNDFIMRDFEEMEDGSFIGVAENVQTIFVPKMAGTPQNPRITYDEQKLMNDFLVYKLDSLGRLVWAKRIPKSQKGVNEDNRFLSATICITQDKIHLFFNDLARNYDSQGKFIENQPPYPIRVVSRSNVIASVEINCEDGTVKRISLPGLAANDVIFNPSFSFFNRKTNEVIFYGEYNRRNRFGYLKLD